MAGAASSDTRKSTKAFAASRSLSISRDRSHDGADKLRLVGQRTGEIDSGDCNEFADLLKAEIDLATRDSLADQLARDLLGLGRHLVSIPRVLNSSVKYRCRWHLPSNRPTLPKEGPVSVPRRY